MGFWDEFNIGDLISAAAPAAISGVGQYLTADQGQQDAQDRLNQEHEFQTQQAATAQQNAIQLAELRAALDKGPGAMLKAAKIKAQTDRERMLQESYLESMKSALTAGHNTAGAAGDMASRVMGMRYGR